MCKWQCMQGWGLGKLVAGNEHWRRDGVGILKLNHQWLFNYLVVIQIKFFWRLTSVCIRKNFFNSSSFHSNIVPSLSVDILNSTYNSNCLKTNLLSLQLIYDICCLFRSCSGSNDVPKWFCASYLCASRICSTGLFCYFFLLWNVYNGSYNAFLFDFNTDVADGYIA